MGSQIGKESISLSNDRTSAHRSSIKSKVVKRPPKYHTENIVQEVFSGNNPLVVGQVSSRPAITSSLPFSFHLRESVFPGGLFVSCGMGFSIHETKRKMIHLFCDVLAMEVLARLRCIYQASVLFTFPSFLRMFYPGCHLKLKSSKGLVSRIGM